MEVRLRDPKSLMKLSKLGSFHQSKLSFLRSFLNEFKEWDYKRNFPLEPQMFSSGSNNRMYWICSKCKISFKQIIYNRAAQNQGCPDCARKRIADSHRINSLKKHGTLKDVYPVLAKEFMNKLNKLSASDYSPKSKYKAWWKCKKHKHLWQATIIDRTSGHGCMKCRNDNISETVRLAKLKPTNTLQYKFPEIAKHWHKKNGKLLPSNVAYGSRLEAWFKCNKNHVFKSKVNFQTTNRNKKKKLKCPKCRFISLKNKFPNISSHWDKRNLEMTPDKVAYGSAKKYWFKCKNKHIFETKLNFQTAGNSKDILKCPKCYKLKL